MAKTQVLKLNIPKKKLELVMKRVQNVPKIFGDIIQAKLKKDAVGFIKTYQQGLKNNSFGLRRLKASTIARKSIQGLPMPENPLYGYGDRKKNSYYNMFYIQKLKKGYEAKPRWAKHHSSDLKLRDLFSVHEYGRVITTKNATFRIPARPAGRKAYIKYMKSVAARSEQRIIKQAINNYIKKGEAKIPRSVFDLAKEFNKYAKAN